MTEFEGQIHTQATPKQLDWIVELIAYLGWSIETALDYAGVQAKSLEGLSITEASTLIDALRSVSGLDDL